MADRLDQGIELPSDNWKRTFREKLQGALSRCAKQFEEALDRAVVPVFDDLAGFLRDNGFDVSTPLSEPGRRSFKCQLAENAYVLLIFRFATVGEFELHAETFVPGAEPILERSAGRLADIDEDWTRGQLQARLDRFIDLLAENTAAETSEALIPL
jgi:hypothetical protein